MGENEALLKEEQECFERCSGELKGAHSKRSRNRDAPKCPAPRLYWRGGRSIRKPSACRSRMSLHDVRAGCHRRVPEADATEGCRSKPSQQDAIAECHSTMSHKTVTAAGRSNIAARYVVHVARCHSNDLQHSVTEGCQGNR